MRNDELLGQRFSRLLVLSFHDYNPKRKAKLNWNCRCDCGKEIVADGYNLRNGNTRSCGCYKIDRTKEANTKDGRTKGRVYYIYYGMLDRCFSKNSERYDLYGGRGITVCPEWLGESGFETFARDMGPRPSSKHSVEREDNNGPYNKANCVWATQKQQCRNKRDNVFFESGGQKKCLAEICEDAGLPVSRVWWRLNAGFSLEQALSHEDFRSRK